MRKTRVWVRLLGLGAAVVEEVNFGEEGEVVVSARPRFSAQLMRVAWRTVGTIIERVVADTGREVDLLAGLKRIGIGEISRRKGQRYITVVIDHDTGRWCGPSAAGTGRRPQDRRGVLRSARRRALQTGRIGLGRHGLVDLRARRRALPGRTLCVDAFHVVHAATDGLDEVRREVWNDARRAGQDQLARHLKGARFALWKNPENLTDRQQGKLASIQHTNKRLFRAYLLKEQLRQIYRLPAAEAITLLDRWIAWARRCRQPPSSGWPRRSPPNAPGCSPRSNTASLASIRR